MPPKPKPKSKKQARYMFAHAKDKGSLGKAAREMTGHLKPGSLKGLPESKSRGSKWYG